MSPLLWENGRTPAAYVTYAVSPSNTLDQPGLDPGRWRPRQAVRRMCLYFSTGCRFSNLHPGQADSPCCSPPDIQFPHCFDHKRGACWKGRQDKHRDPSETDGAAAAKLQPENNSTYSVLACLPSPYVFSLYQ